MTDQQYVYTTHGLGAREKKMGDVESVVNEYAKQGWRLAETGGTRRHYDGAYFRTRDVTIGWLARRCRDTLRRDSSSNGGVAVSRHCRSKGETAVNGRGAHPEALGLLRSWNRWLCGHSIDTQRVPPTENVKTYRRV